MALNINNQWSSMAVVVSLISENLSLVQARGKVWEGTNAYGKLLKQKIHKQSESSGDEEGNGRNATNSNQIPL